MRSRVDVIIPTYKRADMLDKVINSVLSQTYKDVCVTVVDDNDPNTEWRKKTSEIMDKFVNESRVNYICHEKNKNGSAARNTGLKNTNGEFVCFLDDDDIYLPDKLGKQVKYLIENIKRDACFCDYKRNGEIVRIEECEDFSRNILLGLDSPQTSGIMFRRYTLDKLKGFDESYNRHQDYELLLRFFDYFSMGKVNEVLYIREKTYVDNRLNGRKLERLKKKLFNDFEYKLNMLEKNEHGYKKKAFVYNYLGVLKGYVKDKDIKNVFRILLKMISSDICCTMKLLLESFRLYVIRKNILKSRKAMYES